MSAHTRTRRGLATSALWLALVMTGSANLGADCGGAPVSLPGSGAALFTSPQTNPLALSPDGTRLYVANTTSGSLSVVDVTNPAAPVELSKIPTGLDPVGVAVRPKVNPGDAGEDELVLVTNHISDSIAVVSRTRNAVIQTVQALDAAGVTTTDEPVGVAFASPFRAFVSLDNPNQILVLDLDVAGKVTINPSRIQITAQAPRAITVSNGRLYVAAFESNNATEFPTCAPNDNRGLNTNPLVADQGCSFKLKLANAFSLTPTVTFTPGPIFNFVTSPNIGGRVIHDTGNPDRDLFVFDATTLAPIATVNTVGTLLYGVAVGNGGNRVYVTNTDARNVNNGLTALGNQMFLNRLAYVDCTGGCTTFGAPTEVDLDVQAPGAATFPTPYGIAVSDNGATLVVTAAGSDGTTGWNGASGLYTLSATGAVQGSVRVGAIPQGVALKSAANGSAQTAFVLNTVDSTISVVDVTIPTTPALQATLLVGADPTPTAVKRGRIAFSTARGSTAGTFSCESCHPNANTDQLLWTINTLVGPGGTGPSGEKPEPRSTMPIRGLRDTLPLHWDGTLADPIANSFTPLAGDSAPDCDINAVGEVGCVRHLVNASLSGVMCAQPSCATGPSGLAGALTSLERDDMALFLTSVAFPPSPKRLPTDALSANAAAGFQSFFTDDDGEGVNHSIGQLIGFAPTTCADNTIGCHSLPLTVSTNSQTVGRFDAPSIRGLWDRYVLFSNGFVSSEEALVLAQGCANGIVPTTGVQLPGDPCNPLNSLNPVFPTGETVWDPAVGATERGSLMGSFELAFNLVYGIRGDRVWDFINEMSVGLPGLTGRQISLDAATAGLPATVAAMDQLEAAANAGKITAVARGIFFGELRFRPSTGLWTNSLGATASTGAQLRLFPTAFPGEVLTLTAELPETVAAGGPRQPLLSPDGPAEVVGEGPPIPRPLGGSNATITLTQAYVDASAKVLVDGAVCSACSLAFVTGGAGAPAVNITLAPAPAAGIHAVQVLNPNGLASNEMPLVSQ
jgi:YVTN family beta-propeller protein